MTGRLLLSAVAVLAAATPAVADSRPFLGAIGIDLAGPTPATKWVMDVDICLKGRTGYALEP